MQSKEKFEQDLAKCIDRVFADHPEIRDHRKEHSWLTGSLGDPCSDIWFVAESPSLIRIEAATKRGKNSGSVLTPNSQWGTTKGSQVFRKALVNAGFKDPEWDSPDGWHCYITNVIKEAVYVKKWTKEKKIKAAETWAPVLRWQLKQSSPKLVVLMGEAVEELMRHLERKGTIVLPPTKRIHHYSFIAYRPDKKRRLGPMHPDRIKEYQEAMLDIRCEFNNSYASKDAR